MIDRPSSRPIAISVHELSQLESIIARGKALGDKGLQNLDRALPMFRSLLCRKYLDQNPQVCWILDRFGTSLSGLIAGLNQSQGLLQPLGIGSGREAQSKHASGPNGDVAVLTLL